MKQPYAKALVPDQSDSTLVGAWLNAMTPGASQDYSATGNDGTDTAIIHEEWGATFNGTGSYITIPDNAAYDYGANGFTISAWIKLNTVTGEWIYDQRDSGSDGVLVNVSSGKLQFVINSVVINSTTVIAASEWVHVVAVRDGDTMKMYINGVLDATTGDATGESVDTTTDPRIGARSFTSPLNYLDGQVANVDIYNETKPADWVKKTFCQGVPDSSLVLSMQGDVTDESVYGLTFTPQADAICGDGYELDGTGDYLLNSTADWRSADTQGTIMAWIKRAAIGANHTILASADSASNNNFLQLRVVTTNLLSITSFIAASGDAVNGSTTLAANRWYHVACVSNGTAWALYVNGIAETLAGAGGTNSGEWFGDISSRDNVTIGTLTRLADSDPFNGTIDDLKVHSGAKSADYIRKYYLATRHKY